MYPIYELLKGLPEPVLQSQMLSLNGASSGPAVGPQLKLLLLLQPKELLALWGDRGGRGQ